MGYDWWPKLRKLFTNSWTSLPLSNFEFDYAHGLWRCSFLSPRFYWKLCWNYWATNLAMSIKHNSEKPPRPTAVESWTMIFGLGATIALAVAIFIAIRDWGRGD